MKKNPSKINTLIVGTLLIIVVVLNIDIIDSRYTTNNCSGSQH